MSTLAPFMSCLLALVALSSIGCGLSVSNPALFTPSPSPTSPVAAATAISGHVGGANWAVSNSSIELYAVGTGGMAAPATMLLTKPATTDSSGNFTINETYTCPSPSSELYLVANGGSATSASASGNPALSLMTVLGACNTVSAGVVYPINEVTTVGSVWPLSAYMASATKFGASSGDSSFAASLNSMSELINPATALSPGTNVPAGFAVQTAKLYTLADDLHACVASRGGTAGDGSVCGTLFSLASTSGSSSPSDTLAAALELAQNNQINVSGLFQLNPGNGPFEPALAEAPKDWDLDLVAIPPAPTFTPGAGAYQSGQQIALGSSSPGAAIHYTLDGSTPGLTSPIYSSSLTLTSSEMVRAVAVVEDIGGSISSAAYSVSAPVSVSITPTEATLAPSQTLQFSATVLGASNAGITWTINPAIGTISGSGLYQAPSTITSQQVLTVSASSSADPSKSANASITLNPPVASSPPSPITVTVAPGAANLEPGQTQIFTANVTGTANTNVTWSLSPMIGTISATGVYTAPSSIISLQNVTVTASSAASPASSAGATIAIAPGATVFYVDNVSGSDSNTGTSASAPFASIAKVNSLNLMAGQTVAFRAGDVWHEMLVISHSGSVGMPINYMSYGPGAQPVIDASDTVSGWTQNGNVWSHPQDTNPLLINFSGQAGTPVSSSAAVSVPLQYAWDGVRLYVYSTGNPTSVVEVAARPSALTSSGASYIRVSNLEMRGGTDVAFCGVASPCDHWDFESNTFDSGYSVGLHWQMNNGVNSGGLTVNSNTFRGTGSSGIGLANGGAAMGDVISNNNMTDLCKVYAAGSQENAYCDAINVFSQTGTDGGGQITNNTISQVGLGAGAAYGGGIHADTVVNWDIEHNNVSSTAEPGVFLEKGSGSSARYNLLVNAGQYQYYAGLFLRAGDGLSVSNMVAAYNTVVGGYWSCGLSIWQNSGYVTATNITISQNICTGSQSGVHLWLDAGFAAGGNQIMNNGLGVAGPGFVNAGGTAYDSYPSLPATVPGSIAGDPQFVNPFGGNYNLMPTSPDGAIGAFPIF